MKSSFKWPTISKKIYLFLVSKKKNKSIKIFNGNINILYLKKWAKIRNVIYIHNGKNFTKIKYDFNSQDNFFFLRNIRLGSLRFTKKHCIYKVKKKKK